MGPRRSTAPSTIRPTKTSCAAASSAWPARTNTSACSRSRGSSSTTSSRCKASWVTMGPKIGQLALFFGANDMGSVMMEENVVSAAGTTYKLERARDLPPDPRRRLDAGPARSVLQRPASGTTAPIRPTCVPLAQSAGAECEEDRQAIHRRRPGLDDGADRSVKLQLPLLGETK